MRLVILFFAVISVARAQDPWRNIYSESAWEERDKWQRPEEIIDKLDLKSGSKVADIGSHEGYMTMKLSRRVGSAGKVYAVDVEQDKLDKLDEHLHKRDIKNVTTVKGDYDNPHLPLNTLDGALIIDTYHEMDDHEDILKHVKAALKKGGKLVICEPIATDRKKAARDEQERRHELSMNYALEDVQNAGYLIVFKQDPFIDREKIKGDKMWIIVAEKP